MTVRKVYVSRLFRKTICMTFPIVIYTVLGSKQAATGMTSFEPQLEPFGESCMHCSPVGSLHRRLFTTRHCEVTLDHESCETIAALGKTLVFAVSSSSHDSMAGRHSNRRLNCRVLNAFLLLILYSAPRSDRKERNIIERSHETLSSTTVTHLWLSPRTNDKGVWKREEEKLFETCWTSERRLWVTKRGAKVKPSGDMTKGSTTKHMWVEGQVGTR